MIIGITGTIGSGKSTVVSYLKQKGYRVFDCDKENAKLLKKGSIAYPLLLKAFPECFHNEKLDKKALANIIFHDDRRRKKLENIIHPLILKEMKKQYKASLKTQKLFFAEVPLLFEAGWQKYFDTTLLVVCDKKIAFKRLVERGMDENDAKIRIKVQMSVVEKRKIADNLIYNNKGLEVLYTKVDKWIKSLC